MSLDPALRTRIASLLEADRVVLFMKGEPKAPQCGFSARAVAILQDLGVPFASVDVLADGAIREGIKQYGQWPTIPQLYVDGQLIGGSDIVEQMANSGELCSQRSRARPRGVRHSVAKPVRCTSAPGATCRIGVSTSTKPWSANHWRIAAWSPARACR